MIFLDFTISCFYNPALRLEDFRLRKIFIGALDDISGNAQDGAFWIVNIVDCDSTRSDFARGACWNWWGETQGFIDARVEVEAAKQFRSRLDVFDFGETGPNL